MIPSTRGRIVGLMGLAVFVVAATIVVFVVVLVVVVVAVFVVNVVVVDVVVLVFRKGNPVRRLFD